MPVPGPAALGRGVVLAAGQAVPRPWAGAPMVTIDDATLTAPADVVSVLHEAWAARRPVVVVLAVDPARFRTPETWKVEPWALTVDFEPWLDRLHFLVWTNAYDAREGDLVWWWARKAARLGATPTPEGQADICLADGRAAWVDGGPRAPFSRDVLGAEVIHCESVELGRLTVSPAPMPLSGAHRLAADQLAAATHRSGAARVIAPAGSGKTRVLAERLRHLIVDRGVEREVVLAVAYNKKAQEELEARSATFRPRVRTLNALGYSLLAEAVGRAPTVLDERAVRRIVEKLVPKPRRRANVDPVAAYLEALSTVRLGLRDPEEVEAERDDVPGLAEAFPLYREALAAEGAIDFDEQIYGAMCALLADGDFRRRAQARCRHLLVDEFQDLTPAHVLLLRLLATPGLDVFGVGDDDQVIYGHAGADPAFLIDFSRLFPTAAHYALEVNYRCPVQVVDVARNLLAYNRRRVTKAIRPGPKAEVTAQGAGPTFTICRHAPEEGGTALAGLVKEWLAAPGVTPAEVAVLTRVNSLLLAPHVALAEVGITLDSVLRPDVLERTGMRAALAYLRIATSSDRIEGSDLVEIYRRPSRGLPQWITKWFRGRFTVKQLRATAEKLGGNDGHKLHRLIDDVEAVMAAVRDGTTRRVLAVVRDEVGLGGAMGLLDGSGGGGEGSSHLDDLEALAQVSDLHPEPATFEPWLRTVLRREVAEGGVTLSTVHRVKGREWNRVALFGASAGLVPHRLASDDEEERRVLHVAVTRGRHYVAVLGDASRPSPFLEELTGTAPHRPAPRREAPAPDADTAAAGPRPRKAKLGPEVELAPEAVPVEEALRAWRRERCRQDQVPAYIVLHDRTLRAIASARPSALEELARIDGIGPTKLETYGEEILAVLEQVGTPTAKSTSE